MKKNSLLFFGFILVLSFALCSCSSKEVTLGSVGGLELKTSKAVRVDDKRPYNIFRLKEGLEAVKSDLEQRYADDATLAVKEVGTKVLTFSRKRLNKIDERIAETWMFPIGATDYLYMDVCARLVASADFLEKTVGALFWLPIKHMTSPQVVYINEFYTQQLLTAYENIAYPLSCEYEELKAYYINLGFYRVEADDANQTFTLTLKETDDDLANYAEEHFRVSVRVSYESADAESSSVKGYFKASAVNL